mmetsp:Transcript_135454/g.235567  ORF Transcript_135454/g.235567 Transcript_135454/m.235567 type:complete len:107 (-) Transcript_135454:82-402(-)
MSLPVAGEGRVLFRSIMRLHRTRLPETMRKLGDPYVRKEFRLHYKPDVKEAHKAMFISQWQDYAQTLSAQTKITGKEMSSEQLGKLNDEQKKQLGELEKNAKTLVS